MNIYNGKEANLDHLQAIFSKIRCYAKKQGIEYFALEYNLEKKKYMSLCTYT